MLLALFHNQSKILKRMLAFILRIVTKFHIPLLKIADDPCHVCFWT